MMQFVCSGVVRPNKGYHAALGDALDRALDGKGAGCIKPGSVMY